MKGTTVRNRKKSRIKKVASNTIGNTKSPGKPIVLSPTRPIKLKILRPLAWKSGNQIADIMSQ